jgi:hypothetical protein
MYRESFSKSVEEHVTQKTTDLFRYSEEISGLYGDEQSRKTTLETTNDEKTLTVRKSLLDNENE